MNERAFLNDLWKESAGMKLRDIQKSGHSLMYLKATQWSTDFERKMRNRLIMGALRYGLIEAKGKPIYNRLADMKNRLDKYKETGNDELLVDVANLALLEFIEGRHPKKHFRASDDAEHTKT